MKNRFANMILNRMRRKLGQDITPQEGAVKGLLRSLKSGGSVALLIDQNTRPRDGGEFVEFFGLQVPMTRSVAVLSKRTGAGIVFGFCTCDRRGRYTMHIFPVWLPGDEELEESVIMRRLAESLENTWDSVYTGLDSVDLGEEFIEFVGDAGLFCFRSQRNFNRLIIPKLKIAQVIASRLILNYFP